MKYIVVSGGVLSGLGKGVTAASIGLLLKAKGIKVTALKCDMYLNIDAGTMNPMEHGEVFVTHDGLETDQDLGHYERFLDVTLNRKNYMTNGQLYKYVLEKERALEYDGICVEPYHHIPPEIIKRWYEAGKDHKAEVVMIELGGTVGEYEGLLFFEAVRRLKQKHPNDILLVHVGYLPAPSSIGELKSKPMQQSISQLNSLGLQPDFIVCRAEKPVDNKRKEKISLASGVEKEFIVSNPDMECIYEVPLVLEKELVAEKIIEKLGLNEKKTDVLKVWTKMIESRKKAVNTVNIAIVGKYQKTGDYTLEDSYVCVVEALKHAGNTFNTKINLIWVDSEKIIKDKDAMILLKGVDGILVPQGWGSRGVEGKICAIKYARENNIPYLGLCFGMQMATIEFARNVIGLSDANSQEVNPKTKNPVIHIMPNQVKYLENKQYGGTIRMGAWPCEIKNNSKLQEIYRKYGDGITSPWYIKGEFQEKAPDPKKGKMVYERHRHRYEFNKKYKKRFDDKGFVISGTSPDGKLVEAIELKDHPFFIATQFHPEYISRPLSPHPLFVGFIEAAISS